MRCHHYCFSLLLRVELKRSDGNLVIEWIAICILISVMQKAASKSPSKYWELRWP